LRDSALSGRTGTADLMSAIIKSGSVTELSAVRPIKAASFTRAISKQDEERNRLQQRIAALEEELRKRDEAMAALRADVERAFEEGKTQGRNEGLMQAEDRQAERFTLLENGVQEALDGLSKDLSSLERLSALLARECLDKILGASDDRAELVGRIIAEQIGKIERSTLLGIEVSRADFPDDQSLAALGAHIGLPSVALTADAEKPSGACTMTLRLGRMDVGLDQQWSALREVLGEMALPENAK
jgi:flagellar biosynthesis/type III secretory pathway protein FliH